MSLELIGMDSVHEHQELPRCFTMSRPPGDPVTIYFEGQSRFIISMDVTPFQFHQLIKAFSDIRISQRHSNPALKLFLQEVCSNWRLIAALNQKTHDMPSPSIPIEIPLVSQSGIVGIFSQTSHRLLPLFQQRESHEQLKAFPSM